MVAEQQPIPHAAVFEARRAWLVVVAPGMLAVRVFAVGGAMLAPWWATVAMVPAFRWIAAALLVMHAGITGMLLCTRIPIRGTAALALGGLVVDAVGCGVLIAADGRIYGGGGALALVVIAMSITAGGWRWIPPLILGLVISAGIASRYAVAPLIISPMPPFQTILSVDALYDGTRVLTDSATGMAPTSLMIDASFMGISAIAGHHSFPKLLSVETSLAGIASPSSATAAFLPLFADGLAALCVGTAYSLLRVRRARAAVAGQMITAGRLIW